MNTVETSDQPRSTFVTVLAWIVIATSGLSTFVSIFQNIMIATVFPIEEFQAALNDPEARENVPAFTQFIMSHIQLLFFSFLIASSIILVSAIGLLKRKNWARILFIVILSLGIGWNIIGLVLQQFMFSMMPEMPAGPGPDFDAFITIMKVFSFLMALGMSILFGWIIKRLLSPAIKQEFLLAAG